MAIAYYIIPMSTPPWSFSNPQRPLYIGATHTTPAEIRCNWTGHNVDTLGVYVCKVAATETQHTDLASRAGVRQLPRAYTWDTALSTMPAAARNAVSNWCNSKGIAYDATETIGDFLLRVINTGVLDLGDTTTETQFQNLTPARRGRITALCTRRGIAQPTATETLRAISRRIGKVCWDAPNLHVEDVA